MDSFFSYILQSLPLLLQGAMMTLQVMLISATVSMGLGLLFGIFTTYRLKLPFISKGIEGVTFILRAVPFFVQLLIAYFVIPDLFGWNLNPFVASVLSLGLCSSGYTAQIVRAGINSIVPIQWESAFSLGYNTRQSLLYVILPQMFRNVLPAINNELDSLLKSTAIASSIGMLELTRIGMNMVSREMRPVPIFLTVAVFYVCMSAILNLITRKIEKKLMYVKS